MKILYSHLNHYLSFQDSTDAQLSKALREKEDLQLLLNKFERHMAEV